MNKNLHYIWVLVVAVFLSSCSTQTKPKSMERNYDSAIRLMDNEQYTQAIPLFQKIIDENPGTRFAAYSYLKIGDAYLESNDSANFDVAEANYRIFLNFSTSQHLVPYVLSRLIELNYKRNTHSIFGESYSYSRDPEHFEKILNEFQRFSFLYPDSTYIDDAKIFYDKSVNALAEHELMIADWYYDHSLYWAAISRYEYVLYNYPEFKKLNVVARKLVVTYRLNQQLERSAELERILKQEESRI